MLLLDEATSALDQTTEAAINRTLLKVAKGRTMIFSTHRLTSVVDMDEIIVISNGRRSNAARRRSARRERDVPAVLGRPVHKSHHPTEDDDDDYEDED